MGWYIPPEVVRGQGAPAEGDGETGGASSGAGAEVAATAEPVVRAAPSGGGEQPAVETPAFRPFQAAPAGSPQGGGTIDLLLDVPLQLTVELGQAQRTVREILELAPGTVVELDRLAGEPVDLLVNGRLIARGEVVVIDENFGIRITDIVSPGERLRRLR
ncbi:MAG: flagellar motor switch protein FliN [Bacillota bacterium]|nr:MAG: flagellar motor switch protein FliN [Bacillota bacterium]